MSTGTQPQIETQSPPPLGAPVTGHKSRRKLFVIVVLLAAAVIGVAVSWRFRSEKSTSEAAIAVVRRGDFTRVLRVNGTVEAVQFLSISAPRLSRSWGQMVVTKLVENGKSVRKGDVLVQFDDQNQIRDALDREADYKDLLQQVMKRKADQAAQLAADRTEIIAAQHTLQTARLELRKNEVISQIDAEKNQQTLQEAEATLAQLQQTFELKRRAAEAELRTLEIQRDRASNSMQYARQNSERVIVRAPLDGIVVLSTIFRMGQMGEVKEGDQVRPGTPFMKLVNPDSMQVRAKVNQTDIGVLTTGLPVRVTMDAYPTLTFPGKTGDIATVGQASSLNAKVRYYPVIFSITGNDPRLMPDLSAAVDVELERKQGVLLVPRDTLVRKADGWVVFRKSGSSMHETAVIVAAMSDVDAVIQSGVPEGAQLVRNPLGNKDRQ